MARAQTITFTELSKISYFRYLDIEILCAPTERVSRDCDIERLVLRAILQASRVTQNTDTDTLRPLNVSNKSFIIDVITHLITIPVSISCYVLTIFHRESCNFVSGIYIAKLFTSN